MIPTNHFLIVVSIAIRHIIRHGLLWELVPGAELASAQVLGRTLSKHPVQMIFVVEDRLSNIGDLLLLGHLAHAFLFI